MKQWISIVLVGGLVAGAALSPAQARPWAEVKKSGVIYFGADPEYPPFFYQEGKVNKGFEYEIGQEIARRLGVKPSWKLMPYDSIFPSVAKDNVDLNIASTSSTASLNQKYQVAAPHYCSGAVVLSKMDKPVSINALRGTRTSYSSDTAYVDNIKKLTNAPDRIKETSDTKAISQLAFGKADAYVGDKFLALDAMKRFPSIKFQMSPVIPGSEDEVVMFSQKGNTSLISEVNKVLADMLKDGTYKKISQQYFNKDIRCTK